MNVIIPLLGDNVYELLNFSSGLSIIRFIAALIVNLLVLYIISYILIKYLPKLSKLRKLQKSKK